jgi:hypothetical protein
MLPKSKKLLEDALSLAEEALEDLEMSKMPLTTVALKASRLSRLLNNQEYQTIFQMEASGYPCAPGGYSKEIWSLLQIANRTYKQKEIGTNEIKSYGYGNSIEQLEEAISSNKARRGFRCQSLSPSQNQPLFAIPALTFHFSRRTISLWLILNFLSINIK